MTIKSVILSAAPAPDCGRRRARAIPSNSSPLTGERSLLQETALRPKDFPRRRGRPRPLVVTNEGIASSSPNNSARSAYVRHRSYSSRGTQHRAGAHFGRAGCGGGGRSDPAGDACRPRHHRTGRFPACDRDRRQRRQPGCAGDLRHRARPPRDRLRLPPQRRGAGGGRGARALLEFVEKPDRATAEAYVASGAYYWNSGIFMMKASRCGWRRSVASRRRWPRPATAVTGCTHDADFIRLDTAAFERSPSDSIDYAVMEARRSAGAWAGRGRAAVGRVVRRGRLGRCGRCRPRTGEG